MRVRLLPIAERDLIEIYDHIDASNPDAARAIAKRIEDRIRGLADFPYQGRPGLAETRELVITETPYLAFYRVGPKEVLILRVLHGARQRP